MEDNYAISSANKVRQLRKKARYDKATVHAILDAGLVAHVAFAQEGAPVVVPMIYGRVGETLYLHGARKARVIRALGVQLIDELPVCNGVRIAATRRRSRYQARSPARDQRTVDAGALGRTARPA